MSSPEACRTRQTSTGEDRMIPWQPDSRLSGSFPIPGSSWDDADSPMKEGNGTHTILPATCATSLMDTLSCFTGRPRRHLLLWEWLTACILRECSNAASPGAIGIGGFTTADPRHCKPFHQGRLPCRSSRLARAGWTDHMGQKPARHGCRVTKRGKDARSGPGRWSWQSVSLRSNDSVRA